MSGRRRHGSSISSSSCWSSLPRFARCSRRDAIHELPKLAGDGPRANLGKLLQHDEEIIEEPCARRPDIFAGGRRRAERVACRDERALGRVEAREQRPAIAALQPRSFSKRSDDVPAGQRPRMGTETRGAEHLALDRAVVADLCANGPGVTNSSRHVARILPWVLPREPARHDAKRACSQFGRPPTFGTWLSAHGAYVAT